MSIRNRTTGEIITISEFKSRHPRTSFPKKINNNILNDFGYDPVFNGPDATVTAPYEISVYNGVEEVNGKWFTKYIAGPVFTDNDEGTAAEHETAWRAQIDAAAADKIRSDRDQFLAECDWTVLPDSPLTTEKKTEWQTYRQALRDITDSESFPHNVTWPTKPS
jgi:hypothetical protein|tara:strand:+ start:610 stop:1101 length:492 start_codon:yes stop_codon:yes gene_type:complete